MDGKLNGKARPTSRSRRRGSEVAEAISPTRQRRWRQSKDERIVNNVTKVLRGSGDGTLYKVSYEDGTESEVSHERLARLPNGINALNMFNLADDESSQRGDTTDHSRRDSISKARKMALGGKRGRPKSQGSARDSRNFAPSGSEMSVSEGPPGAKRRRLRRSTSSTRQQSTGVRRTRRQPTGQNITSAEESSEQDTSDDKAGQSKSGRRGRQARVTRSSGITSHQQLSYDAPGTIEEADGGDEAEATDSEGELESLPPSQSKPKQRAQSKPKRAVDTPKSKRYLALSDDQTEGFSTSSAKGEPARRSGRSTKTRKNMKERLEDEEVFADSDATRDTPKTTSVREIFQPLSSKLHFSMMHNKSCDVCGGRYTASNKGVSALIYCQGCTTSIHQTCLGNRAGRDHIVTKIGDENFVLQCRRCIGLAAKKDPGAPDLGVCSGCKKAGSSCAAFSPKRTAKQEEKLRDENGGVDPITDVSSQLINNAPGLLFRCTSCRRGFHFEHLPQLDDDSETPEAIEALRQARFDEYKHHWQCKECTEMLAKVESLVAWRPADPKVYTEGTTVEELPEDAKEYLVKWEGHSYFQCTWMPGVWVWGVTRSTTRNAFIRRDEGINLLPKLSTEDAIPEEYLRMEIVLDVAYSDNVSNASRNEERDRANIGEVEEVFVKFQGLSYEEVVWEKPPSRDEGARWAAFEAAYNEYVSGLYFKQPQPKAKERIQAFRKSDFEKKVEMKEQPAALVGGKIMPYQLDGLNWLLYNYHSEKNVVLADEMGLGKTIQVISLLTALITEKPKCWPFLVVVPNSTCPNWRREIKQWAPSLRVVTYYGLKKARDMAMEYELYPNGSRELHAHVVVTSYEAPVDDYSRQFFKGVKWAGMIVDEGQRLKNDTNLLYGALSSLNIPFRVLLTGTPLQNNKRELFNLLQFLDSSFDAADLDEKYAELTNENLPEIHELIRPYFLRRTKAQVLKFLPPMAQVIIPVTMSIVQKKLYKSILAKNPELIKSIFNKSKATLRPNERSSLNNILIQLRKCLCHPFIYSQAIEERSGSYETLHRNLVDASSKLQLLEIMLPKLKERGHRVLIFSQFLSQLDIVEDFLDGLGMSFRRLDGNVSSLEKQKRIDEYNEPDSDIFAFLLTTRAGGVGINLATADTVIIMDPDFNPHQDIQALSRAHRIGQKNKVLVFKLMTKDSAEEKIIQIGRRKMALDHALIESMDGTEEAGIDLESILRYGAEALFNDNDENDIHYDSASVDKLLDRTQIEDVNSGDEKSTESAFSFARVWANNKGLVTEEVGAEDSDASGPNPTVWDKILEQREADAALEAARNQQSLGRGKRVRQAVDYQLSTVGGEDHARSSPPAGSSDPRSSQAALPANSTPVSTMPRRFKAVRAGSDEAYEPQRAPTNGIGPGRPDVVRVDSNGDTYIYQDPRHAGTPNSSMQYQVDSYYQNGGQSTPNMQYSNSGYLPPYNEAYRYEMSSGTPNAQLPPGICQICRVEHTSGICPIRCASSEACSRCQYQHYGASYVCPQHSSEGRIRLVIEALKQSAEAPEHVEAAWTALDEILALVVRRKRERYSGMILHNSSHVSHPHRTDGMSINGSVEQVTQV